MDMEIGKYVILKNRIILGSIQLRLWLSWHDVLNFLKGLAGATF